MRGFPNLYEKAKWMIRLYNSLRYTCHLVMIYFIIRDLTYTLALVLSFGFPFLIRLEVIVFAAHVGWFCDSQQEGLLFVSNPFFSKLPASSDTWICLKVCWVNSSARSFTEDRRREVTDACTLYLSENNIALKSICRLSENIIKTSMDLFYLFRPLTKPIKY